MYAVKLESMLTEEIMTTRIGPERMEPKKVKSFVNFIHNEA